jgi:hypothetical protein
VSVEAPTAITDLVSVFDRPKTVAIEWRKNGTVTKWNATFMSVVGELGVGVELC